MLFSYYSIICTRAQIASISHLPRLTSLLLATHTRAQIASARCIPLPLDTILATHTRAQIASKYFDKYAGATHWQPTLAHRLLQPLHVLREILLTGNPHSRTDCFCTAPLLQTVHRLATHTRAQIASLNAAERYVRNLWQPTLAHRLLLSSAMY